MRFRYLALQFVAITVKSLEHVLVVSVFDPQVLVSLDQAESALVGLELL